MIEPAAAVPSVVRHRPFALFWFSRVLSTLAYHMQAVAVGWQVYALTGSAFYLGLVGLAQFLTMILLTLLVGQAADRYDRRVIVGICQTVEAAATATLAIGTFAGWLGVERMLGLVAVIGAARAFEGPTMSALMPTLVPRALIPRGSAWLASANQTSQIVGPAVGGFLYAAGATVPYGAASLFYLAATLPPRSAAATSSGRAAAPGSTRCSPA